MPIWYILWSLRKLSVKAVWFITFSGNDPESWMLCNLLVLMKCFVHSIFSNNKYKRSIGKISPQTLGDTLKWLGYPTLGSGLEMKNHWARVRGEEYFSRACTISAKVIYCTKWRLQSPHEDKSVSKALDPNSNGSMSHIWATGFLNWVEVYINYLIQVSCYNLQNIWYGYLCEGWKLELDVLPVTFIYSPYMTCKMY